MPVQSGKDQDQQNPSASSPGCVESTGYGTVMTDSTTEDVRSTLDRLFHAESRRILATLIRLIGDFDAAEDALQEAFAAAAKQWPEQGIPANPRAWLISTGRYKGIDAMRRRSRFEAKLRFLEAELPTAEDPPEQALEAVPDDQLRLIFTCCHPALPVEARSALTLREVCGLTTEEIARAFLSSAPTVAQRIVRAKAKIRDARIPYQIPSERELPERLETVLQVIYLVFNEGYAATAGGSLTRADLSAEAIRLGRLLAQLLPMPEAIGLLALMLLQESRRAARTTPEGDLILLADQDRSLWNRQQIAEGIGLVGRVLANPRIGRIGTYTLQAAIAAVHAVAPSAEETDWGRIVDLYELLYYVDPSPVIELNRAVAVAMRDGAQSGLDIIEAILARGELMGYHLAHSVRAELFRRLGRREEARQSFRRALDLTRQEPERRFLRRRLQELG
ncbi:MAG: RNA polymerase sigma factor [Spirochaetales bacterium]|nr:RNA polymerase sigma factor [Spirochaetales bacterium]